MPNPTQAQRPSLRAVYFNRRMAVLLGLGFSSGLPLMLTGRTLKVWVRDQGIDLQTVGLLSLVTLPYTLKFIWAPLVDRFALPGFGRRRGWLLMTQLALVAAVLGMAFTGPSSSADDLTRFAALAVVVAFFSATQDIVADAYRTDVLDPSEYGAGASVFTSAYRVAMIAGGAGAVFLADRVPWAVVYQLAAAGMCVGMISTLLAPEPAGVAPPATLTEAVVEPLDEFFRRTGWAGLTVLAFVVLFKLPDQMAGAMTDPLLLDLGFSKTRIAVWGLGLGVAVSIPGALIGGPLVVRLGVVRSLVVFGLAQAFSNLGYLALALVGKHDGLMMAVIGVEYFCAGLVAAGFIAFLMRQCDKRYSATQFALLTSLMAFAGSWAGAPTGWLVERLGYPWFFVVTIAAAVPGMLLLPVIGRQITLHLNQSDR